MKTRHGNVTFEYIGYETQARLADDEDLLLTFGKAMCAPVDAFQRRIGRKVALEHALKNLPRQVRKEIWEDLWSQGMRK